MPPINLATRSLTASCLLHVVALSSLAAWAASTDVMRPRFAGQRDVIELVVTRSESTWSPNPVTFADAAKDEVRVTVQPTTARISRKQFDQLKATDRYFDTLIGATPIETNQVELELGETTRSNSTDSITDSSRPPTATLPRQQLEPRQLQVALVQPPQSLGTDRTAPSFSTSPPPTYPAIAIRNNWEGTVLLRVYINQNGSVDEVEVARSSGYPVLDGAAVNAVRRWSGSPATERGREIATVELLPVQFRLRD